VAAGAGAGCLIGQRRIAHGNSSIENPQVTNGGSAPGWIQRAGTLAGLAALAALHLPAFAAAPRAPEGGIATSGLSVLDLTDAYLPQLADSRQPAVLSNVPMKFLAQWTYLQRFGRALRLETEVKGPDFEQWLSATKCDTIIYVNIPPHTPHYANVAGCEAMQAYGELLAAQNVFEPVHHELLPKHGCTVTVWKKSGRPLEAARK
jgi:hypothetical protein